MEAAALAELKRRGPGRKTVPIPVDPKQYRMLQRELVRKETALLAIRLSSRQATR